MLLLTLVCLTLVSLVTCDQDDDFFSDHGGFNGNSFAAEPSSQSNSQSYAYLAKWYPHLKRFVARGGGDGGDGGRGYSSGGSNYDDSLGIDYMPHNSHDSEKPSSMYSDDGPGPGFGGGHAGSGGGDFMFGRYGSSSSDYDSFPSHRHSASSKLYPSHDDGPSSYSDSYESHGPHGPSPPPPHPSAQPYTHQPSSYGPRYGPRSGKPSGYYQGSPLFTYGHSLAHHESGKKTPHQYDGFGSNKYDFEK